MTPGIATQTLLRDLHPKQFGRYDVHVGREHETSLFHMVAKAMDFPVWAVHILEARVDLNTTTAEALRDEFEDVVVEVVFRVNAEPQVLKAVLMVPSVHIEALSPVKP